jgi:hypothetical protein
VEEEDVRGQEALARDSSWQELQGNEREKAKPERVHISTHSVPQLASGVHQKAALSIAT